MHPSEIKGRWEKMEGQRDMSTRASEISFSVPSCPNHLNMIQCSNIRLFEQRAAGEAECHK